MKKNLYYRFFNFFLFFLLACSFANNANAQITSSTFVYTGSVQTYTVPAGVTSVTVDARGANGGLWDDYYYYYGYYLSRGGYGARVMCTLTVTSGQVLNVYVGGNGDSADYYYYYTGGAGGWNGGGNGYSYYYGYYYGGGGGGGGTDIRTGGTAVSNRVIVAGGGGGAGYDCSAIDYNRGGDGGGLTGEGGYSCNSYYSVYCGGGGTQNSGGAAASAYSGYYAATPGGVDTGGTGSYYYYGGGGGGGYYGGGGGAYGGGGGGSSWVDSTQTDSIYFTQGYDTTGNDSVIITVNCSGGVINGTPAVCVGYTTTLSDTVSGGTGTWSSSSTAVATVGSSTGVVSGISGGTATITYSVMAYCGSVYSIITVTVNPMPTSISGTKVVCAGSEVTLSDALSGGTWSCSNTAIAAIDTFTGVLKGVSGGTATITYSTGVGVSCVAIATVTVNPIPSAITGGNNICMGFSLSLSDVSTGATWSSTATAVATIGSTGVVASVSPGTATISYTFVSTGCAATDTITVNPLPGGISGLYNICVGSTTALTDAGGGAWSSGNTGIATVGSSSGVVTGVAMGNTAITYTLPTGCLTTVTVTVYPLPPGITGTTNVCVGLTTNLSDGTSGGVWASSITSSATIGSGTGVVTGISAGTTTITYTAPSGCATTVTVVVNPIPGPITGLTSICKGATTTLSDGGGGTWSSGATPVATAGSISGLVTGVSAGTAPISYTLPTGCLTTVTVTVYPLPTAILGPAHVCPGSTVTLSDATGGGTWTSQYLSVAAIGLSTGVVSGYAYGTTTITYTVGSGCATTMTFMVDSVPAAISGPANLCLGNTSVFSDAGGGIWSSSNTAIVTVGSSTGLATGIALGTATITYTLTTGCTTTLNVKVNPVPTAILGTTHVCVGNTSTLTDATGGGTWTTSATVITIGITTGLVTGLTSGMATVTYTLFSTGCYVTTTVTVSPAPAPITGASGVCAGLTITLSDAVSGGVWSSGTTGIATVGGSGVVTGVSGGTSTITYSPGAGCAATKTVTVYPLTPITGATTICAGATTTLADGATGGTWSSSNTGVATVVRTSGVVTGITTGTATVTYLLPTGCSATVVITVSPSPSGILGLSTVCTGASIALSDAVGGGLWSSGNTTIAGIGSTSGIVSGLTAGVDTISYSLGLSCVVTKTISVNLSPGPVAGTTSMCVGGTVALTDATSGGTWSSSNTGIATAGGTGVITGVSAGTATITYNTGCIAVTTVTVIPTPAAISGPAAVCQGSAITLSDATGGGTWSSLFSDVSVIPSSGIVTGISAGTAILSYSIGTACISTQTETVYPLSPVTGATTICVGATTALSDIVTGGTWSSSNTAVAKIAGTGVVTGIATGTTTITYLLPTGCEVTTIVTVSPSPSAITGAGNVCAGLTLALSDAVSGGAWSSSSTATASVSGTGIVTGLLAGITTITYSLGSSCIVTASVVVNASPAAISGTTNICAGATTALSDITSGGVWSNGSSAIATVSGSGVVTGVSAGSAPITYTVSGCSVSVTVNVYPIPLAITGTATVCVGNTTVLSDVTLGGAWSSSNSAIAGVSSGIVSGISAGTAMITYATGAGCIAVKTATVYPISAILGAAGICVGNTTTLSDATTGGTWGSSNTSVATISSGGLVSGIVTGTATITYLLPTGCSATKVVTVNSIPSAITGITQVCAGATTVLIDGGGGAWSSSNTAKATIGAGTGVVTGIAAGTSSITYSLGSGCIANTTVSVNPLPLSISGSGNVCAGLTTVLSDLSPGGAWGSSNTAVATITGTGIVTGITPGSATVTYTLVTGCYITRVVNVSSTPTGITGAMQVCPGNTTTLTDVTGGGTWSSSSSAVTVGLSTGIVTGILPATAKIIYAIGSGCSATAVVTVNPLPGAITGTPAICVGATTNLYDGGIGTWNSDNTLVATITGGGLVSGLSIGTSDITYTLSGTGCSIMQTVTVNSLPPAITGIPEVCAGQVTTLTDAGGGAWSSSSISIAKVGAGSGIVTGIKAGVATITYSMGAGCNSVTSVTVDAIPPAIKGVTQVCAGATITLSDALTGGVWSNDNFSVATINPTSGLVSGLMAGTTTVSYTLSGCPALVTVTVNPLPSAISGSAAVCVGSTAMLSDAGGGTWSSPGYSVYVITGSATGFVTGVAAGTALITYTQAGTGCTTSSPITINPVPSPIAGPSSVCVGQSITLSDITGAAAWSSASTVIATVTGAGVVTGDTGGVTNILYAFTATGCYAYKTVTVYPAVPPITGIKNMCAGGATMYVADVDTPYGRWTSTFVTISTGGMIATYDTGVGIITYTMPTGCFITATLTVQPIPALITGPLKVCTGQSIALSDSASGGLWSSPDLTVSVVAGSGVVTGASAGTAMISYTFATGCAQPYPVTVYQSPSVIAGAGSVCVNSSIALNDTFGGGAWGSSSGIASVSGAGVVTGRSAGIATIYYTMTGSCTADKTVSVMPLPVVYAVSGGGNYCAGGTGEHVYLGGSASGIRYELYNGGTIAGTLSGIGGLLDFGLQTAAGDYKVLATNTITSCAADMADSAIIVVNPLLYTSVSIAASPSNTVCAGTPVTLTAIPVNGGLSPIYHWKVNGIATGGAGAGYTFTPANGNVVIVALTSDAACATPPVTDTFITMNVITQDMPLVTVTADPGNYIGYGNSVTLTAAVTSGGASPAYEWLINGVAVPGAYTNVLIISNVSSNDTVICEVTSGGMCSMTGSGKTYINVNSTGTGVKQVTGAGSDITVLPNPSKGNFTVKGPLGSLNDEEVSIEITDLLGQVIYRAHTMAHNGTINEKVQLGNSVANGMYLLNLRSESGNSVFHIVVEQ